MTTMVDAFRRLYNTIRPHETLAGDRPIERYLADPNDPPTAQRQRANRTDARAHRIMPLGAHRNM
jgi:hypothetical protein